MLLRNIGWVIVKILPIAHLNQSQSCDGNVVVLPREGHHFGTVGAFFASPNFQISFNVNYLSVIGRRVTYSLFLNLDTVWLQEFRP